MSQQHSMGQWSQVGKSWALLGSPLRPVADDIAFFRASLAEWLRVQGRVPRGLILGVTPELYGLDWPDRMQVRAVDRTQEMVDHVWPGLASQVVLEDWRSLSFPPQSLDIVMCDGGLHLLDYPAGQHQLFSTLTRLVAPQGMVVLRLFAPPPTYEAPGAVIDALLSNRIPSLNHLKLRLGMALQANPHEGVNLDEVWQTLRRQTADWATLAQQLGWPLDHLSVVDAYRGSKARYHFVTLQEVEELALEASLGALSVHSVRWPGYELGDQCPTVTLLRHGGRAEA